MEPMEPIYMMIYYAILFILCVRQYLSIDSQGMCEYDRTYGIAGDGRFRGMLGTVYNADGSYSFTYNIMDTNPLWQS